MSLGHHFLNFFSLFYISLLTEVSNIFCIHLPRGGGGKGEEVLYHQGETENFGTAEVISKLCLRIISTEEIESKDRWADQLIPRARLRIFKN